MATIDFVRALAKQRRQRGNIADHFNEEGLHRIGPGLYIRVKVQQRAATLAKTWVHRYSFLQMPRSDTLGNVLEMTLEDACLAVDGAQVSLDKRHDPRGTQGVVVATSTFKDIAEMFFRVEFPHIFPNDVEDLKLGSKHQMQWIRTVRATYKPTLGSLPIAQVDQNHIADVLRKDWKRVPETADRVLGRLHTVIGWAIATKRRAEPFNPADRDIVTAILRGNNAASRRKHFAALDWPEVPAFMRELRGQEGLSAIALQLLLRTVKRTTEVLNAGTVEFDLEGGVWSIPPQRMKIVRPHVHKVPLTTGAVELLRPLLALRLNGPYLFPGMKHGRPLTNMVMLNLLGRMGYAKEFTPHGFRATFRTWVEEVHPLDAELAKVALAHKLKDKVDAAYQRSELLERRRVLMQKWDDFIDGREAAKVVPLLAAA